MKKSIALIASALLIGCSPQPKPILVEDIAGLWQFPNRAVWVQINPDGSAFQCRAAPDNNLFFSTGSFSGTNSIIWEREWGTDLVYLEAGDIILHGKYGKFTFTKARNPMSAACRAIQSAD